MIEEKGLDSHPILIPNLPISSTAKRKKIDSNYYMFHDAKRASLVGFNAKKNYLLSHKRRQFWSIWVFYLLTVCTNKCSGYVLFSTCEENQRQA